MLEEFIMRFLSCLQPGLTFSELTTLQFLTLPWPAPLLTAGHLSSQSPTHFGSFACPVLSPSSVLGLLNKMIQIHQGSPLSLSSESCSIYILFHVIHYLHRTILSFGLFLRSLITRGCRLGSPETDSETKFRVPVIYEGSIPVKGMGDARLHGGRCWTVMQTQQSWGWWCRELRSECYYESIPHPAKVAKPSPDVGCPVKVWPWRGISLQMKQTLSEVTGGGWLSPTVPSLLQQPDPPERGSWVPYLYGHAHVWILCFFSPNTNFNIKPTIGIW